VRLTDRVYDEDTDISIDEKLNVSGSYSFTLRFNNVIIFTFK